MNFDEYQEKASVTATFAESDEKYKLMYLTLGITSEAGEVADKIKKVMRNDNGVMSEEAREAIKTEIGDVLWYLSQLSRLLGISFDAVAEKNIAKILDRQARNVIKSTGDNR
jgi:NTP pyrophosphatase (non-canonical NTP hydrolase)